jgi:uncharacterized C2H2 Zn-finger protein
MLILPGKINLSSNKTGQGFFHCPRKDITFIWFHDYEWNVRQSYAVRMGKVVDDEIKDEVQNNHMEDLC